MIPVEYTTLRKPRVLRFGRITRSMPQAVEQGKPYDVAIVGGAINGSAIARELALRGASVLLLDSTDPNRATNRSSCFAHGGLRYLPHWEFSLVREARQEVATLLKTAKHLVRPLSFVLPVYKGDQYPPWMVKAGLVMYDWFCGDNVLPKHRSLSKQQLKAMVPGIVDNGKLRSGFQYYDTQMPFPERLTIENLRDAQSQHTSEKPVDILTHTRVNRIKEETGHSTLQFTDQLDGMPHLAQAKIVINASGHTLDKVIEGIESPYPLQTPQMGPTKGTHIWVKNTSGLTHTIYSEAKDGRPYFIIPFPAYQPDHLMIGTTDDKTWTSPYPTRNEVRYLLDSVNERLPDLKLQEKDVVMAYAGFRPLPFSDKKAGAVTRKHIIRRAGKSRIYHIIGGKITTQRSLAQEVGNAVAKEIPLLRPSQTRHRPLPGARGMKASIDQFKRSHTPAAVKTYSVPPQVVHALIDRYGVLYTEVLDLTRADASLKEPLLPGSPLIEAQAVHAIHYEGAETLMDLMTRSLKLDMEPDGGIHAIEPVLTHLAKAKQLTPDEKSRERGAYLSYLAQNNAWRHEQHTV